MNEDLDFIARVFNNDPGQDTVKWPDIDIGSGGGDINYQFVEIAPRLTFVEETEPGGPQYVWPSWTIYDQEIKVSPSDAGPQDNMFVTDTSNGPTFYQTPDPGPTDQPGNREAAWGGRAGVDGGEYKYGTILSGDFAYLPAFSGNTRDTFSGEISGPFPDKPYDPDNDIYPMDTITRFVPDEIQERTITYTITTWYRLYEFEPDLGPEGSVTTTVTQKLTTDDDENDFSELLEESLKKTYYYHGIYHIKDPRNG